MDINQNSIESRESVEININRAQPKGYIKNVDNDLSSRLRPTNPQIPLRKKLSKKTKFFYSLGHVYNDLTVSIWFSYTLLYFKFQFDDSMAGALILIGQMADAIASPFVGFQSDRPPNNWLCRYGRRKTWHLLGVVMNTISVPILYNTPCLFAHCEHSATWVRFLYYSVLIVIFQAGWAATQVSHVSLIVDLTDDTNERMALNSYRQAATIGANICLYSVTLFVIGFKDQGTLKQDDLIVFTRVSYIVCGIGLVFSILFHIFVKEPEFVPRVRKVRASVFTVETKRIAQQSRGSTGTLTLLAQSQADTASSGRPSICHIPEPTIDELMNCRLISNRNQKKWSKWLTSVSFWKITIMYTMARMFVNLSQVYTPLYLQDTLMMPKITIAVIPFATYVSGLICSFAAKPLSIRLGSRWMLIIGAVFGIISCAWMFFDNIIPGYKQWQIYGVSACIGIGGTALLISSLALTSDLIGSNTSTGAFVFSAMSLFDKSVNGVVIALLEHFKPKPTTEGAPIEHYKWILICITGVSSIAICLGLLAIIRTTYGRKATKMSKLTSLTSMH